MQILNKAKKIVVKIGSSLIINDEGGCNDTWLASIADDIANWHKGGKQITIVSSGAIALGRKRLGLDKKQLTLTESQAAAAAGQIDLANGWGKAFQKHSTPIAQILLTLEDSENRKRYLNARNTLNTLLQMGSIAIINENDTIATHEIRYGDNDRLSGRVAGMISADCLVMLSDIDGFYTKPPHEQGAKLIAEIDEIDEKLEAMAQDTGCFLSKGGMKTKLIAARHVMEAGCHMILTSGREKNALSRLEKGATHSLFRSHMNPRQARKQWIAGNMKTTGSITIDEGCATALQKGASLLPAGMVSLKGSFDKGDIIDIFTAKGTLLAKGIVNYSSPEATQIIGKKTQAIEDTLGYAGTAEMIHRDDMVMVNDPA